MRSVAIFIFPLILAENGVLPHALSEKLAGAVGLRNRLVHVYTDIDHEMIYDVLTSDLEDLQQYAERIVKFCDASAS